MSVWLSGSVWLSLPSSPGATKGWTLDTLLCRPGYASIIVILFVRCFPPIGAISGCPCTINKCFLCPGVCIWVLTQPRYMHAWAILEHCENTWSKEREQSKEAFTSQGVWQWFSEVIQKSITQFCNPLKSSRESTGLFKGTPRCSTLLSRGFFRSAVTRRMQHWFQSHCLTNVQVGVFLTGVIIAESPSCSICFSAHFFNG